MSLPLPIALLVSSLLVVGLASALFRDRPASKRLLIIGLVVLSAGVPIVCLLAGLHLEIGVPGFTLPLISTNIVDRLSLFLLLSGLMLVVIQLVLVFKARRRLSGLPVAGTGIIGNTVRILAPAAGVTAPVSVRSGSSTCSSSLGGKLIVFSAGHTDWQPDTLRAVLAHELVHVSRRDDVWLLLARLLVLQFWWLPWCRLIPGLLETAIEESCDDLAAYLIRSEQTYLRGVFEAATGETAPAAGTVRASGGSVLDRFRRFSSYRDQQVDSRGLYWSSLGALAGLALVWTLQVVPAAPPLSDRVRIVGTAVNGPGPELPVRLAEPPIQLGDNVTRDEPSSSDPDPP